MAASVEVQKAKSSLPEASGIKEVCPQARRGPQSIQGALIYKESKQVGFFFSNRYTKILNVTSKKTKKSKIIKMGQSPR